MNYGYTMNQHSGETDKLGYAAKYRSEMEVQRRIAESEAGMTTVEILKAAKELIADPARWCQGEEALNESEKWCSAADSVAVKWCAVGAAARYADVSWLACIRLLDRAAGELYEMETIDVNDHLGHKAVLSVYDRAIELAEAGDGKATE